MTTVQIENGSTLGIDQAWACRLPDGSLLSCDDRQALAQAVRAAGAIPVYREARYLSLVTCQR